MSRVLARNLFKKKAPKKSAKGVGITSMFEDDVAGYAEGGEVNDDRTERERIARQLLEQNRDENSDYQMFSEQERPRMYRPPATTGMMQQPNPQQMQAAQMQQMAAMGMIPRFQEGGSVEVPSLWSRMRQGIGSAIGMRGRSDPMFARGSGPEIGGTTSPMAGSPAMDNPNFQMRPTLYADQGSPVAEGVGPVMKDIPPAPGGGASISLGGITDVPAALLGIPRFSERTPPSEAEQAAMEADREARRAKGFEKIAAKPPAAPPKEQPGDRGGGGGDQKKTDISDIKAEREAKAAAARQENMWLALMQAGLAIAGGKSPNAITNIGQGGQAGLASFMALEQQRRRDEDAAMRRDLAEREYGLQQRRLAMQEPYYQALTQAQTMRPLLAAQDAARRDQLARLQASSLAQKAWADYQKNNQPELLKLKPEARKMKEDIFLKQKLDEFYQTERLRLEPNVGMPQSRSSAGTSPEE